MNTFPLDKFAIEAFLYSADFGEDGYLLASSSSSSESDPECCCSEESDNSEEKPKPKRPKVEGFAEVAVPELPDSEFKKNFRVERMTCDKVTELIRDDFLSDHKGGWERITPVKAGYVLLWYLTGQETFKQMSDRFKITQSCIYHIVKVGCRNLSKKLDDYIKWPVLEQYEEESIAFYEISKISGIVGALGVSHVKILKPRGEETKYLNAKGYQSIAVQGIIDSNCKFLNVCVCEGSLEPVEVLNKSTILSKVQSDEFSEYFLVGNVSYPSLSWLVTPFQASGKLDAKQELFNKHHGYAYAMLNSGFARLKERFQRLNHFENKDIPFIINCIQAACVVHNICMEMNDVCEPSNDDDGIFEYEVEEVEEEWDDGRKTEVLNAFIEGCDMEDHD